MIKYLILFLIILVLLLYFMFHFDIIKIPFYDNIEKFGTDRCYVKQQGNLDVNMTQCKIYYADNRATCDSYPELYKLTILQLDILLTLSGGNSYVQYNGNNYDVALINNVKEDKLKNNIEDACGFTPDGLYEIEGSIASDGTVSEFTYEGKRQFGCFLPLNTSDISGDNIKENIINRYGDLNKACIDDTNKTPVTNINCVGTSCPETNDFHVITNFDNIKNNYNIDIKDGEIFLKIYDRSSVSFVKYNKSGNILETIDNNSINVKSKFDSLYEIKYKNPTETFKYPQDNLTASTNTYSNGITISVYASSGDDAYKIFNTSSTGWNTTNTTNNKYFLGYSGEFLKFDLGQDIVLKNFNLHPDSTNTNKSPKNYRIYATNEKDKYDKLGDLIKIKENNEFKLPTKITTTDFYYYSFTNKGDNNSITFLEDTNCDILIIGGGAAGMSGGGGGSSGGVIYFSDTILKKGTYDITVGIGGINSGDNGTSSKIENKSADTILEAIGGISSVNTNGASGTGKNIAKIEDEIPDTNIIAKKGNDILKQLNLPSNTIRGGGGGAGSDAEKITVDIGLNYTIYDSPGGSRPSFPKNGGRLANSAPKETGVVRNLLYNWGGGKVMGHKYNNVIINFTGYIRIPGNGNRKIIFYVRADDGFYMKINNEEVINSWFDQGPRDWNGRSNVKYYKGGELYPINIWFYEHGGGAVIQLYWKIDDVFTPVSGVFTTSPNYGKRGGEGITNDITGTSLIYSGGGSSYNDISLTTSSETIRRKGVYGYGGDSLPSGFTPGGDGVVIFRFQKSKSNEGWNQIYQHSPIGTVAPTSSYKSTLSNILPYRYYAIIVNNNWENSYGCSISQLELFGYRQSRFETKTIEPPAIYATPTSTTKEAYLFIFDKNNKIKEVDKNNVANFSLKDNFKIGTKDISDKLLNTRDNTPAYGRISRIISQYINSINNGNMTLNLSEIDAKIAEYNTPDSDLETIMPLSKYKQAIFNDINITGLTFQRYDDYTNLYNGKFYMSNDDNIYIKL